MGSYEFVILIDLRTFTRDAKTYIKVTDGPGSEYPGHSVPNETHNAFNDIK